MLSTPRADTSSVFVGLLLSLLGSGFGERRVGNCHWLYTHSAWSMVVREDASVSFVAVAFVVKDTWTIMMEFACFAFVALTFQVVLA